MAESAFPVGVKDGLATSVGTATAVAPPFATSVGFGVSVALLVTPAVGEAAAFVGLATGEGWGELVGALTVCCVVGDACTNVPVLLGADEQPTNRISARQNPTSRQVCRDRSIALPTSLG